AESPFFAKIYHKLIRDNKLQKCRPAALGPACTMVSSASQTHVSTSFTFLDHCATPPGDFAQWSRERRPPLGRWIVCVSWVQRNECGAKNSSGRASVSMKQ